MVDLLSRRRVPVSFAAALAMAGSMALASMPMAAQELIAPPSSKPAVAAPPLPEVITAAYGDPPRVIVRSPATDPPTDPPLPAPTCSVELCDPAECPLGPNRACLVQTFQEIQWHICAYASQYGGPNNQHSKGIEIGPVYLRRLFVPNDPWHIILYKAGLAEVLTTYHSGQRFYDTAAANWSNWRQTVTAADAGPNGTLITLSQDTAFGPSLVAECRDRGPAWLCKQTFGSFIRRGQELALWGVFDAGNYDFITEYGFRDDGSITMRVGATGYNNPTNTAEAHMHDTLWRIDMDLDGAQGDSAVVVEHFEPLIFAFDQAVDVDSPFNFGVEGGAAWSPTEFTSVRIDDAAVNAFGDHLGYELEPLRSGNARHFKFLETWTHQDFWVTRWHDLENTGWATPWQFPDEYLLSYVNNESVTAQDLVLWYYVSGHHHPTSEDRDSVGNLAVTSTHWFGLQLRPHNFFDRNPLGGPPKCGP